MRRSSLYPVALASVAALLAGHPFAAAVDFQVNTFTAANQLYPSLARAADGAFVVVWESQNFDGNSYGILGQRFDPAGARVGAEFQINSYTSGAQRLAAVSMSDGGAFVVVWRGGGNQDGSDYGIFGRRFDSSGVRQAAEFQVNVYTALAQGSPAIALDADGDFVVVWQSRLPAADGSTVGIVARLFASDGTPLTGDFQVNTYTSYGDRYPAVASDQDGDFVVTWDSRNQDGGIAGNYGVFAQRFSSAGAALAQEFQVNLYTPSDQFFSGVAVDADGDFVVVWQSYQDGPLNAGVMGRRFDSSGAAVGGEFRVNASTVGNQRRPAIAAASAGDFLVTYSDSARDGSSDGIAGRRFDAAGTPLTDFVVNSYTVDDQRYPAVALGEDGGFVVAWQSAQQDGFGSGIFAAVIPALALLDIDGDGMVAPLTDGLLVVRDLFGFTGGPLVNGAVDSDCTRCEAPAITSYFDGLGMELDVDDDGLLLALTDGVLILRYVFGFTGPTLVNGAVGEDCNRCTALLIEPYIASRIVPGSPPI